MFALFYVIHGELFGFFFVLLFLAKVTFFWPREVTNARG